jgi:putative transposase
LLNLEVFADLREAQALVARWRHDYNHRRPHSSLDYATPAAFAARCDNDNSHKANGTEASGALPPNPRLLPLPGNRHDNNVQSEYNGQTLITVGT